MSDIMWFFLGAFLGFLIHRSQKPSNTVELLESQVQQLNTDLHYYKDLCKWHVEEKRKIQEKKIVEEVLKRHEERIRDV